jgi:hypothetical protein
MLFCVFSFLMKWGIILGVAVLGAGQATGGVFANYAGSLPAGTATLPVYASPSSFTVSKITVSTIGVTDPGS